MAGAGKEICTLTFLEASKTCFSCSLKANVNKNGGIPPRCCQLVHGGPFFQKQISHSNTKYSITIAHAT